MKVAFDSRPAPHARGVGRYARCLLRALRETADQHAEIVETHRPWRADVFHSPWLDGAMLRCPCPMVVTLQDLTTFKLPSEYLRAGMRVRLRHLAIQRAARVIVPNEAVAEDAIKHIGIARERIVVIPEAPDSVMFPRPAAEIGAVRDRHRLPEHYLLSVGSLNRPEPRKQLTKLVAARRSMPLVLVGPARAWMSDLPNVTLTGEVDDDALAAIYSGAHAIVLPAEDASSGLAAVEALACGTPVIAYDIPPAREVLGGCTLVPRGDVQGLIDAAERPHGPPPAPPAWSWEDAGRATWRVYKSAMTRTDQARATGWSLRSPSRPRAASVRREVS